MQRARSALVPVMAGLAFLAAACADTPSSPDSVEALHPGQGAAVAVVPDGPHVFAPPVFDIEAMPNGNILVAETAFPIAQPPEGEATTVFKEIHSGGIREVGELTHRLGSPINGLAAVGQGDFFATGGGLDLAGAASVWRVSRGTARLVGDIEAFAHANNVDATQGPAWKADACEENPDAGFSAGPHSNPYHLTRLSGRTVLVGDAAGNTVLAVDTNGGVDWVAVLTPPVADGTASDDPEDWMVLFPLDADTDCYAQPVPTSVAVGPDGAYYVGELTGVTPGDIGFGGPTTGLSRVWRIEAGARNVTCPSEACELAIPGFTSIIDVAFGPDGMLYVVEYDENNWFRAVELDDPAGGTVHRCDVGTGDCQVVADGLVLPAAITFDKWGGLWLLEKHLFEPTVRRLN